MSEQIILNADLRERTGSNKARVIRKIDGMVPAIVYGDEKDTLNLKLRLNELTKASQNELFYTQVLIIKNGDNGDKTLNKKLTKNDKIIAAYKDIEQEIRDSIQKIKSGNALEKKTSMDFLKSNQDTIKAYNNLKKV
jgi:ribosomal protein L25 (general stress protein Ctc)